MPINKTGKANAFAEGLRFETSSEPQFVQTMLLELLVSKIDECDNEQQRYCRQNSKPCFDF